MAVTSIVKSLQYSLQDDQLVEGVAESHQEGV